MTLADKLIKKGEQRGMERGIEHGMEQGAQREKEEIIQSMLSKCKSLEEVAEIINLPVSEIQKYHIKPTNH